MPASSCGRGAVSVTWFDLEHPRDLRQLDEPTLVLEPLRGLVVFDEIQNRPELFPVLRVLADRSPCPARFLVLGSASPELLRQGSETLAGRIAFYELPGFAVEQVIRRLALRPRETYFWATHSGAELDLLVIRGRHRLGFEFKRTDSPRVTRSMIAALDTLGLERIDVVHAGNRGFSMHERIRAVPMGGLLEALRPLA